jgi:hypothetical protein
MLAAREDGYLGHLWRLAVRPSQARRRLVAAYSGMRYRPAQALGALGKYVYGSVAWPGLATPDGGQTRGSAPDRS